MRTQPTFREVDALSYTGAARADQSGVNHVAKRGQRQKGSEVLFDEKAHK